MNKTDFLGLALKGNTEAAYHIFQTCLDKEQLELALPDEPLAGEVPEYRELFKTVQSAFEPENRKSALSILKHTFAPQTSEIGALARLMLVFLKSKTKPEMAMTDTHPNYFNTLSLYKKAIAEAEKLKKPELAKNIKQDCEEYLRNILWQQNLMLDEVSLIPDSVSGPLRSIFPKIYKEHLEFIISFYSKETLADLSTCTLHELTRIAIEKLKQHIEFSKSKDDPNEESLATFWLATLYMRQDFYEFRDLPEANYLLRCLEKSCPLDTTLHTWIQAKRSEIDLLEASHFFGVNNESTQVWMNEKQKDAKAKAMAYAISSKTPPSLKGIANLRLALFILNHYPEDFLTVKVCLERALQVLNPSSYLIPLVHYQLGKLLIFGDPEIYKSLQVSPDLERGRKLLQLAKESYLPEIATIAENFLMVSEIIKWEKGSKLEFPEDTFTLRRRTIEILEALLKPYFEQCIYRETFSCLFDGKNANKEKKLVERQFDEEKLLAARRPLFSGESDADEFLKEKLEAKDKELYFVKLWLIKFRGQSLFDPARCSDFFRSLTNFFNESVIDFKEAYRSRIKGKNYFQCEVLKENPEQQTLKLTYHPKKLIRDVLGTTKDLSAHPGLIENYLSSLSQLVKNIEASDTLKMQCLDEKQVCREIKVSDHVASHVLMQGIRDLMNALEDYTHIPELKLRFTKKAITFFMDFVSKLRSKDKENMTSQQEKEYVLYLINATKYFIHLIPKVFCNYSPEVVDVVHNSYSHVVNKVPSKYRFELFVDVARFLKKAHFCNSSELNVGKEWHGALEFYLLALESANEEQAFLISKEICELSPKKNEDFIELYNNYVKYLDNNSKIRCLSYIAVFFTINIQYRRFLGKEQEAEELRALIDQLKHQDKFPLKISYFVDGYLKMEFIKSKMPPLPSQTEMQQHLLETLGPSYPPFEESFLKVANPKKRRGKPSPKGVTSTQAAAELHTSIYKRDQRTKGPVDSTTSIAEQEFQQLHVEQNGSSTTTEAKREAKDRLLKEEERLAKKRAKQPKATIPSSGNALPLVQNLPSQTLPCMFLTPSEMDIFNEFFKPKTSCAQEVQQGNFDAYSFRNDVKISRSETKKLVKALGGKYHLGGAKGNHHKGVIPSLDTNDQMVFGGKTTTVANLNLNHNPQSQTASEPQSETLTVPKSREDCLKFYMVQQIREKLLSLNFSPETVKIRE